MKKKCKKNNSTTKSKNKAKFKMVCPLCHKDKKSIKLNDGYTVCAYCGLVVHKQNYSLEQIDAPGFFKIYLNKKSRKKNKLKKNRNKHHNLVLMQEFIDKYRSTASTTSRKK